MEEIFWVGQKFLGRIKMFTFRECNYELSVQRSTPFSNVAFNGLKFISLCNLFIIAYKDYYIANEEIPFNYVPFSCCDMHLHGEEACQNASATTQKGRVGRKPDFGIPSDQLIVPKHLSFGRGCHNLLHQTILPYILVLFAILLGFNLLTIITNSVYLHLTSKYEYEAIHKTDAALRGEPLTCSE